MVADLNARILMDIGQLSAADWDAGQPGEAEGWAYYHACGGPVAVVMDKDGLVLGAPLFEMEYRLDTPFQGRAGDIARRLAGLLPGLMVWRLLGIGSALAERCHVAARPGLTPAQREVALDALLALLAAEARRRGARLTAFKDVAAPEADWLTPLLVARGFVSVTSLPLAVLDLTGKAGEADYLADLSASTRKDIRRKLKSAGAVRVEHRPAAGDLLERVEELYESTRANSRVRYGEFEELPKGYFASVPAALGDRARFVFYWVGDRLVAFNLLLLADDRIIDKFLGMEYPLARDHNLYVLSWLENVRLVMSSGRRRLQSGQTAYAAKLRFGSSLEPSVNLVRSHNLLLNLLLRIVSPWLGFDRHDPDLGTTREKGTP